MTWRLIKRKTVVVPTTWPKLAVRMSHLDGGVDVRDGDAANDQAARPADERHVPARTCLNMVSTAICCGLLCGVPRVGSRSKPLV